MVETGVIELSLSQKNQIEETVRKESPRLFNYIRKYVRRIEDAEDILQDVFYQLTQNIDQINYMDRISSWLFTVARNRITDLFRKKKAEPMSEISVSQEDGGSLTIEEMIPELGSSPEDYALRTVILDQIEEGLDELPEEQRNAFLMNQIDGKSFREISEETGVPIQTLISRKRYAVLYLRKKLDEFYKEISKK